MLSVLRRFVLLATALAPAFAIAQWTPGEVRCREVSGSVTVTARHTVSGQLLPGSGLIGNENITIGADSFVVLDLPEVITLWLGPSTTLRLIADPAGIYSVWLDRGTCLVNALKGKQSPAIQIRTPGDTVDVHYGITRVVVSRQPSKPEIIEVEVAVTEGKTVFQRGLLKRDQTPIQAGLQFRSTSQPQSTGILPPKPQLEDIPPQTIKEIQAELGQASTKRP